jgi:dynein heavy chain
VVQDELIAKNLSLQVAAADAEKLLHGITISTTQAECEKARVALIVMSVTRQAQVRLYHCGKTSQVAS